MRDGEAHRVAQEDADRQFVKCVDGLVNVFGYLSADMLRLGNSYSECVYEDVYQDALNEPSEEFDPWM